VFDLKWLREHPEDFDRSLKRRGLPPAAAEILALDRERRAEMASVGRDAGKGSAVDLRR